jgi:hypothetical protein
MAKTKKGRLTKGERAIREALTSQGRPLPGTPEDAAWIRGRDYGEKRALEKAKQLPLAASLPHSGPNARPKFSRGMALFYLNDLDEQFNDIASVAISGLAYQRTRAEDHKDPVTISLLRVIQEQTDSSVNVTTELRKMLETLPAEVSHG